VSAEYLSAYAAIGTFLVIAITAIAAVIQLRHIRGANQLTGLLHLTEAWRGDAIQQANKFIHAELPARLGDADYRAELMAQDPNRQTHPELLVADMLEQTGSYIKYGMIDGQQFLDIVAGYVTHMWDCLKGVVALRRIATNSSSLYENFEYLAVLAQDFYAKHQAGNYPRGVRRLMTEPEWRDLAARFTEA
jgi:hypothetical protein